MTEEGLVGNYPRLFHMAHDGAWPSVRDHGLMSAEGLVDAYGVMGEDRAALLSRRRPDSVPLAAEGLPGAVLRDQKPMSDLSLSKCLDDGLTPSQWYELLNSRSFFWLSRQRVWKLLKARAYRDAPQTVLTIDTAGLVAAHRDRIWLSPINSGFSMLKATRRGNGTFRRIADFPFAERRKSKALPDNVVELLVEHSVPDVAEHVLAVHRVCNDQVLGEIWRSDRAVESDRP